MRVAALASPQGPASPLPNSLSVETLDTYLDALASEMPVPGGGSAAAVAAALGAALVAMVARICAGSPRFASRHDQALALVRDADALRSALLEARSRDEAAYAAVVAAQALPRELAAERSAALREALARAAEAPLDAAALALEVLRLSERALALRTTALVSDVGCAAEFGAAGLAACAYNVRVNHRYLRDAERIEAHERRLRSYEAEGAAIAARVRARIAAETTG